MRRFNAVCGGLMAFTLVACVVLGGARGGAAPQLLAAAFVAVMGVCLVINVVVFLLQTVLSLARFLARDVGGVLAGGRQHRHGVPIRQRWQTQLSRHDLIERLCRESGWVLAGREADLYQVRPGDHRAIQYINVRYNERYPNVLFQLWFPIRFPLQQPPSGLSERLLMRNMNLHWSSWTLSIGQSCEACLYVSASLPPASLNPWLFGEVCREMVDEIAAFQQELHDKFAYGVGQVRAQAPPLPPQPERTGVPQRRGDSPPGIWYVS